MYTVKASFHLKENVVSVFKPKHSVSFVVVEPISKELDKFEILGVISPKDFSEWTDPTEKENNNIHVCGDISTGLNECLLPHTYLWPSSEKNFSKLNGGRFYQRLTCQMHNCKFKWMKNVKNCS